MFVHHSLTYPLTTGFPNLRGHVVLELGDFDTKPTVELLNMEVIQHKEVSIHALHVLHYMAYFCWLIAVGFQDEDLLVVEESTAATPARRGSAYNKSQSLGGAAAIEGQQTSESPNHNKSLKRRHRCVRSVCL
jgi:hypothetical protein